MRIKCLAAAAILAALPIGSVVAASAGVPPPAAQTEQSVEALALQWFERMQTGHIDRAQLTDAYSAQLTDDLVKKMSAYLKEYGYGSPPTGVHILRARTMGDQTFYDVKILFPRGDAASLLFGFNGNGKITGIVLMSMAGD